MIQTPLLSKSAVENGKSKDQFSAFILLYLPEPFATVDHSIPLGILWLPEHKMLLVSSPYWLFFHFLLQIPPDSLPTPTPFFLVECTKAHCFFIYPFSHRDLICFLALNIMSVVLILKFMPRLPAPDLWIHGTLYHLR